MKKINKIYARLDKNNVVIKMFSSVFKQPLDTDKLVEEGNEEYHAHVHLKYSVVDSNGKYNYKYENDKLIELTDEEKNDLFPKNIIVSEQDNINSMVLKEIETLKNEINKLRGDSIA